MNNGIYRSVAILNYQNPVGQPGRIIIVGTAHVSEKSIAEVNK